MDEDSNLKVQYSTFTTSSKNTVLVYDHLEPFDSSTALPPLIYIHGGAWKDTKNTANDVDELSSFINKAIPFCSVNYRLSPEVKYPLHLEDVYDGIQRIIKAIYYDAQKSKRISLMGHSVGAMLALQAISKYKNLEIDQLYLVDGIYDLDELVREYPSYASFVEEAHDDYTKVLKYDWNLLKEVKQIHVICSYDDELLSLKQTKWLIEKMEDKKIGYCLKIDHLGKHDEVYKDERLATYVNSTYLP